VIDDDDGCAVGSRWLENMLRLGHTTTTTTTVQHIVHFLFQSRGVVMFVSDAFIVSRHHATPQKRSQYHKRSQYRNASLASPLAFCRHRGGIPGYAILWFPVSRTPGSRGCVITPACSHHPRHLHPCANVGKVSAAVNFRLVTMDSLLLLLLQVVVVVRQRLHRRRRIRYRQNDVRSASRPICFGRES
jgi:hypothetical protein